MKNIFLGLVLGAAIGGAATYGLLRHAPEKAENPAEEKKTEAKEESRVQHGTNGETWVKLDRAVQEKIGVKAVRVESLELPREIKAYGQVLDPTPIATLVAERATVRTAMDASGKENQRLKKLYDLNQNVSARALEEAEVAMKRDKIQAEAVQTRLLLALGRGAAEKSEAPGFLDGLISLKAALVRIDLPLGQALRSTVLDGRVAPMGAENSLVDATYLGPAVSVDPQTQGQAFLFWVQTNAPPVGAAMVGWLKVPGEAQKGALVPRAALLRHEGEVFVYVQAGEELFQRKELTLEQPLDKGWFVRAGLTGGEQVVVQGAQLLLSEELKGKGGGEE